MNFNSLYPNKGTFRVHCSGIQTLPRTLSSTTQLLSVTATGPAAACGWPHGVGPTHGLRMGSEVWLLRPPMSAGQQKVFLVDLDICASRARKKQTRRDKIPRNFRLSHSAKSAGQRAPSLSSELHACSLGENSAAAPACPGSVCLPQPGLAAGPGLRVSW